jgi:hypothetical protein
VTVTSSVAGTHVNTTGPLTGSGANGAPATANLTVIGNPTVAKAFALATVPRRRQLDADDQHRQANAVPITGASLTDTYPAGVVNAALPAATTNCGGGTFTANGGANFVSLTNFTIQPGGCFISVAVKSDVAGAYVDTIPAGALTTTNAGANPAQAQATLTVLSLPTGTKSFTPANIGPGQSSLLTITLTNPNATPITGVVHRYLSGRHVQYRGAGSSHHVRARHAVGGPRTAPASVSPTARFRRTAAAR